MKNTPWTLVYTAKTVMVCQAFVYETEDHASRPSLMPYAHSPVFSFTPHDMSSAITLMRILNGDATEKENLSLTDVLSLQILGKVE